ncbi:MAG: ATP-binding protein [Gemmatimonadota bacterium]|nr:ATP-binding protein [Gemmatimonadota bacterium]
MVEPTDLSFSDTPLPRILATSLQHSMTVSPVVAVMGARQTGKSTLVKHGCSDRGAMYLTLDDLDILDEARSNPDDLVRRFPVVILDEVQRAPDLVLAVKRAVDERREPGRFVLTGSANLLLMKEVADTLAGRVVYLTLAPLSRREQLGFGEVGAWDLLFRQKPNEWLAALDNSEAPVEPWEDLAKRGGYPVPAYHLTSETDRDQWFASYVRTYLERDLANLSAVEHLANLRRLMHAAALRVGNLLNQTDLARDVGLAPTTAQRYLRLLEISYQLTLVPAYSVNRTKRLTKSPKIYWNDTGLALHLAGETKPRGAHLENLIASDLFAWRDTHVRRPEILYWRTTKGAEVDFVIEWEGELVGVEVKAARNVGNKDATHLKTFLAEYPEARGGLVLYGGDTSFRISERVYALPWWKMI